jgi:hypothetical protein
MQAKLVVGEVNDPLEHEADRVADQVMRMPDNTPAVTPASLRLSRKCAVCEEGGRTLANSERGSVTTPSGSEAPSVVHDVLRSGGQPLDPSSRVFMERRFGYSFADVRIHADAAAGESAQAIGAYAYASGNHIVFAPSKHDPGSYQGRKLLAHELAHTIQQRPGIGHVARAAMANSDADEEEANAGTSAGVSVRPIEIRARNASAIARQPPADAGAPACASPGDGRHVTLQPVFLRTDATDAAPTGASWSRRFPPCNTVWNKLGVQFTASSPVTVDAGPLKNGGDSQADRNAIRALWSGSGVGVFFVNNAMPSMGGAGTSTGGGGAPVISDGGGSTTLLAHEVGHTLGLGHPPGGADTNTVMTPTNSNASDNPTRNTLGNYNRITWPAADSSTCLSPDS